MTTAQTKEQKTIDTIDKLARAYYVAGWIHSWRLSFGVTGPTPDYVVRNAEARADEIIFGDSD